MLAQRTVNGLLRVGEQTLYDDTNDDPPLVQTLPSASEVGEESPAPPEYNNTAPQSHNIDAYGRK